MSRPRRDSGIYSNGHSPNNSTVVAYRIKALPAASLQLIGNNQHQHVLEKWEKQLKEVLDEMVPGVTILCRKNHGAGASFILSTDSYSDAEKRKKIFHGVKEKMDSMWSVVPDAPPETRSEQTWVVKVDAQAENAPLPPLVLKGLGLMVLAVGVIWIVTALYF